MRKAFEPGAYGVVRRFLIPHFPYEPLNWPAQIRFELQDSAFWFIGSRARMAQPAGEAQPNVLRLEFDRRLKLEFHGSSITLDTGLLDTRTPTTPTGWDEIPRCTHEQPDGALRDRVAGE